MPRKSYDHLHRLVRSMTPAEKRFYKLHVARHAAESGSQGLLFDAIAAMETYDESSLLKRFKDEPFTHRFAVTKRRLYESVLKSLDACHSESSVDARLYRNLHQVDILHQRTLYDDAAKLLNSVRRSAEQHERTAILMAVAERERRLVECRNYAEMHEEDLHRMADVDSRLREQQAQLDALWGLKSTAFLRLYQHGQARDANTALRLAELLAHPLLRDPAMLTTAKAKFLFHHLHGAVAFALGRTDECHTHLTNNWHLLSTERLRFIDEPNLVLGVLSNLIYVCIQAGRYQEAQDHLRRFRTLPAEWDMPESEDLDLKLFSTTTSLELSMYMRTGEVERALELVPVVERGLAHHAGIISPVRVASFNYQLAYAHFVAGEHDKALRWSNALLNGLRTVDQSDTARFGRMLHLLILLELGKLDLLAYSLRSAERSLDQPPHSTRFEPLLVQLLRNLLRKHETTDTKRALEIFLSGAVQLEQDPFERVVFDHFDPIAWAESKLSAGSFAMRLRARADKLRRAA